MDRTTIENAALELFHKRGFDAVKVQDICAACGITKPTFYHYVPSKDDILLRYYDDVVEIVEAHVAGADLLSRIACSNLQENRGSYDTRPAITERMEVIIATGQRTGVIRNEADPHQIYLSTAYLYEGLQFMWCLRRGDFDWRTQMREGLRSLLQVKA